jgi:hypothetical protein
VGEALVSMLQDKGVPMPVERALMAPPRCRMGALTPDERKAVRGRSLIGGKYDTAVNRESAYEILNKRTATADAPAPSSERAEPAARGGQPRSTSEPAQPAPTAEGGGIGGAVSDILWGNKRRQGMVEALAKQAARSVGSEVGRQILRGVLGGILGGTRRRR